MNKKKWILLLLGILLVFGWIKLFYKTYSETVVPKSADCVIALDTKRIINTIIWNIITTPSQWKFTTAAKPDGRVAIDDMIKLPDYVFIFHPAGQPANAWYTVLEINDVEDFVTGLQQYHFEKMGTSYFSKEFGISFIQDSDRLLVTNLSPASETLIRQTADELFSKNLYSSKSILKKNIDLSSHLSVQSQKQGPLGDEYSISANFDKNTIIVNTALPAKFGSSLTESSFKYCDSSLCTFAFTQPRTSAHQLLPDSTWKGISKILNFDIDSLVLPTNNLYQLDIEGIHRRVDSAVSYTYDDNFNPVEKTVVNIVEEPAFSFRVEGNDVKPIYDYWQHSGKLEATPEGVLLTAIPLVKSYCTIKEKGQLFINSVNYKPSPITRSVDCVLFFRLLLTKLPASLLRSLPNELAGLVKNMESVETVVTSKKGQAVLTIELHKKKNDLPMIEW